jgi:hypothetical protein
MKKNLLNTNLFTFTFLLSIFFISSDYGWSQNLILNGSADEWDGSDNADAFDMTPPQTIKNLAGETVDSPFRSIWYNSNLDSYINGAYGANEQPNSTSDGNYVNGVKTRGYKFSQDSRRMYQKIAVTTGKEYTFSMESRCEAENVPTEIFILNTEITNETSVDATDPTSENDVDAYLLVTDNFNSSKGSATTNTFTTSTFNFTASTNIVVIYMRSLLATSDTESFYDNLSLVEAKTASTEDLSSVSLNLYPNPTSDIVHIGGVDRVDAIRLYSINGQLVKKLTNTNSINLSNQKKGVYMVEVIVEGKKLVNKLIKR